MAEPIDLRTDVAIVGGGLTACAAAIEAAKYGLHVTLLDKGILGRSGSSPTAGGGFSFACLQSDDDTLEQAIARHVENTMAAGEGINDPHLVEVMAQDAPRRVAELEYFGLTFPRDASGQIVATRAPAHDEPRTAMPVGGGAILMDALRREVFHRRVRVLEEVMVSRLFTADGRIAGLQALATRGEETFYIQTGAVILAGGSATGLFPFASANYLTTGDAFGLAWSLGLPFANMAFNEFTLIPKVGKRVISSPGISAMMASGSHLLNRRGERFMPRYDPERAEVTTRAQLVQAVVLEANAGRAPIWNDSMAIPADVRAKLAAEDWEVLNKLARANLKWPEEEFEWVPATHLCLGGVKTDQHGGTEITGLYAAGESATGVHGACRISGNAMSECLVFGVRAGRAASLLAGQQRASEDLPAIPAKEKDAARLALLDHRSETGPEPEEWQNEVRRTALRGVGVVRTTDGLKEAGEAFLSLSKEHPRCTSRSDLIRVLGTRNLILTGRLMACAALERTESRGQHLRPDFPQSADAWRRWIDKRSAWVESLP